MSDRLGANRLFDEPNCRFDWRAGWRADCRDGGGNFEVTLFCSKRVTSGLARPSISVSNIRTAFDVLSPTR